MSTEQDDTPPFSPDRRRLCPDGSCVGLIGDDGKCKVCGTLDSGGMASTPAEGVVSIPSPEPEVDDKAEVVAVGGPEEGAESSFNPKRRLCQDGSCMGVLDSKGQCKICGRPG